MSPVDRLLERLQVLPEERAAFLRAAAGAFLAVSFVVVARALREALFLGRFSIEALPTMAVATAAVTIPSALAFGRLLARKGPGTAHRVIVAGLAAVVLAALVAARWPGPLGDVAIVAFYVGTAVGSLLLTTVFWLLVSERFDVRGAKRLFGPIAAGGTVGAMFAGWSVGPLQTLVGANGAPVGLLLTLAFLVRLNAHAAAPRSTRAPSGASGTVGWGDVRRAFEHPQIRTVARIVGCATAASFLVDFQFKAAAARGLPDPDALAAFFGRFYGAAGVLALLLQLFVAGPLLRRAGAGVVLSVLPSVLLAGSTALLLAPGLLVATCVRGADAAVRRSLHRAGVELLYVPLPRPVRRRAKPVIDSVVDSGAEGLAALAVAAWLDLLGLPVWGLAVPTALLAAALLAVCRRVDRHYLQTVVDALRAGRPQEEPAPEWVASRFARDAVTLTLGGLGDPPGEESGTATHPRTWMSAAEAALADRLRSSDAATARTACAAVGPEEAAREVQQLIRLLARDAVYGAAVDALARGGDAVVPHLRQLLLDDDADFVIRRRLPAALERIPTAAADAALLEGLAADRFEVRYRCGAALASRRRRALPQAPGDPAPRLWRAIRSELARERPVWEMQRLLDERPDADGLVAARVAGRGVLSLEHVFRLLSLLLDPDAVRTAFHGMVGEDPALRSLALEYLEHVLPEDVRLRLWPFIGDLTPPERRGQRRHVDAVVAELLRTGATLFADEASRRALRRVLAEEESDGDAAPPRAEPEG